MLVLCLIQTTIVLGEVVLKMYQNFARTLEVHLVLFRHFMSDDFDIISVYMLIEAELLGNSCIKLIIILLNLLNIST